jgi:hypothetical protein
MNHDSVFSLIDPNSVFQAKAVIEEQANEIFEKKYSQIKERAGQVYRMWQEDQILKSDLERIAEKIAVYAVIFVLEQKGSGELYAEVNKYRSQIKADGYYGYQMLEDEPNKIEWLDLSSQELWGKVVEKNKLLQICLDFYDQEFKPT